MSKKLFSMLLVVVLVFSLSPLGYATNASTIFWTTNNFGVKSLAVPISTTMDEEGTLSQLHTVLMYAIRELDARFGIMAVPTTSDSYVYVVKCLDDDTAVTQNGRFIWAPLGDHEADVGFVYGDDWFYYAMVPVQASPNPVNGPDTYYTYMDTGWGQPSGGGGGGFSGGGGGGRGGASRPQDTFDYYGEVKQPSNPSDLIPTTPVITNPTSNTFLAPFDQNAYKELWFRVAVTGNEYAGFSYYSERDLRDICQNLNDIGLSCHLEVEYHQQLDGDGVSRNYGFWFIVSDFNQSGFGFGYRACEYGTEDFLVAVAGASGSADENKNYYTQGTTSNNQIVNNTGATNNGKQLNIFDGTYYDNSSDSWVVADQITYNTETNNYSVTFGDITNNYYFTYNYTYNITIGASGEYTEIYNYFELPDGRNSYDLTRADIAPLSMEFDITNYDKAAVDTHTLGLWHLDGDTENDAFYQDFQFEWNSGASITYLEATNFNGCLYLGPDSHNFTISRSEQVEFLDGLTLQFRYYVPPGGGGNFKLSAFRSSGSVDIFNITGDSLRGRATSTEWAELPVGQWSDICVEIFVRASGTIYYYVYLNGLFIESFAIGSTNYNYRGFTFDIASKSGAFQYFDEIRLVDYPVYTEDFSPPVVPHDTNNVFVLPDYDNGYHADSPLIAIRSDLPATKYQFGGVRPTFPEKGLVWFYVVDDVVDSTQQWTGTHWEEVGTRVWTGVRWIPLYSYSFKESQDHWDNVDIPYQETPIITSQGFYEWFKTEWIDFRNWLIAAFAGLGSGDSSGEDSGSGGNGTTFEDPVVIDPVSPDDGKGISLIQITSDGVGSIIDVLGGLFVTVFDGAIALTENAMHGFVAVVDDDGDLWQFYSYEGDDIWD